MHVAWCCVSVLKYDPKIPKSLTRRPKFSRCIEITEGERARSRQQESSVPQCGLLKSSKKERRRKWYKLQESIEATFWRKKSLALYTTRSRNLGVWDCILIPPSAEQKTEDGGGQVAGLNWKEHSELVDFIVRRSEDKKSSACWFETMQGIAFSFHYWD